MCFQEHFESGYWKKRRGGSWIMYMGYFCHFPVYYLWLIETIDCTKYDYAYFAIPDILRMLVCYNHTKHIVNCPPKQLYVPGYPHCTSGEKYSKFSHPTLFYFLFVAEECIEFWEDIKYLIRNEALGGHQSMEV